MELAGIPNDMVNQINSILWSEGNETDPDGHIYHFYKRYISGQGEISVKRRFKASAISKKWGSFYYIWLAKEIVMGLIKKEGWYGEQ